MTEINYCNTCPSSIRGICCYHSYFDGINHYAIMPCKYLNKKTRRCKIYKKRFEINPICLDIDSSYKEGALPEECPYNNDYDYPPDRPFKKLKR